MISIQYFVISLKYSFVTTALSIIIRLRSVSCCRHWSFPIKSLPGYHQQSTCSLESWRSPKVSKPKEAFPRLSWSKTRRRCLCASSEQKCQFSIPSHTLLLPFYSIHPFVHLPKAFVGSPRLNFHSSLLVIFHLSYIHWSNRIYSFPTHRTHPHAFLSFSSHLVRSSVVSIFVF